MVHLDLRTIPTTSLSSTTSGHSCTLKGSNAKWSNLKMNEQFQSPLFKYLPPELRQQIYNFALTSNSPITDLVTNEHMKPRSDSPRIFICASVSLTCRKIYQEIDIDSFWRCNTFNFTHPIRAWEFIDLLQQRDQLHLLASISFNLRHALWRDPRDSSASHNRTSVFTEWDHYLTCAVPVERRENTQICIVEGERTSSDTLCSLYDDMHFVEILPKLTGLKSLVLDFEDVQNDILKSCRCHKTMHEATMKAFGRLAVTFGNLLFSTQQNRALECKVRMMEHNLLMEEVTLLADEERFQHDDDVERVLKLWRDRLDRALLPIIICETCIHV